MIHRLLSKLFTTEEINGGERCPTYMYRWELLKGRRVSVYVHRFVADDWSRDMHEHPKRFVSIGLRGEYTEETPTTIGVWTPPHIFEPRFSNAGRCGFVVAGVTSFDPILCDGQESAHVRERIYRAPWFRTFPAEHIHRIRLHRGECWTLVVVFRATRPWGFWNAGRWIPWREYVGSEISDQRKTCP